MCLYLTWIGGGALNPVAHLAFKPKKRAGARVGSARNANKQQSMLLKQDTTTDSKEIRKHTVCLGGYPS